MAELINNLKYKTYKELEEALIELSRDNKSSKAFIDINGSAYLIPKQVYKLIEALYSQVEKLESEDYEL
jgi:hypothetical protein|tara:strand:- start:867 stop:1073 length:207 start_codon:yes stop_codon:yes gene_type:complete